MAPMETIGRYRLTRRLGAGSFATVWLGQDDELDVPVAVKVLADNWAANDDVRRRFLTEARIMRRLRDRRIVQVYDVGTLDDGRPYFVMDFVDGGSLDDVRKQRVAPVEALRLCAEAARALQVLHEHHIIHRDVTPGNLLLSGESAGARRVLIADLGVAKSMADDAGATMTAGTPSYMAVEQATGVGALDHRADVYSLTALTYAILTGRPPFKVAGLADIINRPATLEPAPIAASLGAPPILDALMVSGMATDVNRRPPSAAILADALDSIADQITQSTAAPPPGATVLRPPTLSAPTPLSLPPRTTQPPTTQSPTSQSPTSLPPTSLPPRTTYDPAPEAQTVQFYPQPSPEPQPYPAAQPYPETQPYPEPQRSEQGYPQPAPTYGPQPPYVPADDEPDRPLSFWVLVGLGALALFAVALFITVLVG